MRMRAWAPDARSVELVTDGTTVALEPVDRGYWEVEVDLPPGTDYAYSVDGGEPLPDPRSNHQPDGVDGRSRLVDHSRFEWNDAGWTPDPLERWIIYELHIGTFTDEGTFDAAIDRLDHLVALGINAVEVMPVNQFPGTRGWGYDGVDLWAPHHPYGGPDGFKRFIDACHARDIAVVLDVVYNHLGPAGNYLPRYGPYFTDTYVTPWGDAVNFDDAGSDEVREFFIENALYWMIHYHVDALRLDAVHAFLDRSAKHILEELAERTAEVVERLGRPIYLIAETDLNDPRIIGARESGGYGIDAQWNDDFHHALHSVLTGERSGYYVDFGRIGDLATALCNAYVYAGRYSEYRRRSHGRDHGGEPGWRFLAYSQNHDQVGNRAGGDRLTHLVSPELLKVAAAVVLTSPFVPMLFMGEEWGATTPFQYFTDHHDPALGEAVSTGRRNEFSSFGWKPEDVPDPQDPATFERSKLRWTELDEQPHADLLQWYRDLIRLRRETPALQDFTLASVRVELDEEARWLVMQRGPLTVACNFSTVENDVPLSGAHEVVLTSGKAPEVDGESVSLAPGSVTIFRR